jgi:TonB family protein
MAAVPWPLQTLWAGAILTLLLAAGCGGEGQIQQPAPLYGEVPIEYPLQLWDQDREGETLLRVRVTDMGSVDSVQVLQSAGYPAFDSAAVAGAKMLHFKPARRDGKRIEVWAKVPVHFSKRPRPDTIGGMPSAE